MQEFENIKKKLIEKKAERNLLLNQLAQAKTDKETVSHKFDNTLKAREITQIVAETTQKEIEFQISNLVSDALAAVFPDPYEFKLRFVQRRNKTEADLIFIKNGKECDDILAVGGGGVADVAANIAFPLAIWSIKKTRNVMLWDEPTKFLHNPDYQENASILIKQVSDKLGLQIIMVSDQKNLIKAADKVFNVELIKGISKVKSL